MFIKGLLDRGLLSEVTTIHDSRPTMNAADQAFFGDKQVYTNVSTASTSQGGKADKVANDKVFAEITALKKENQAIKTEVAELRKLIQELTLKCSQAPCSKAAAAPAAKEEAAEEKKDDDFDLFGSDEEEEDEEKKKIVEERLKAYNAKKSAKPGPIAKSSVILDVKPWDDETDLKEMEDHVRSIQMDGLVWGGAKLIPIGYGIQKLQIICVIEDAKVSVDDLQEKIQEFEDHVQSVDIAAFNKI